MAARHAGLRPGCVGGVRGCREAHATSGGARSPARSGRPLRLRHDDLRPRAAQGRPARGGIESTGRGHAARHRGRHLTARDQHAVLLLDRDVPRRPRAGQGQGVGPVPRQLARRASRAARRLLRQLSDLPIAAPSTAGLLGGGPQGTRRRVRRPRGGVRAHGGRPRAVPPRRDASTARRRRRRRGVPPCERPGGTDPTGSRAAAPFRGRCRDRRRGDPARTRGGTGRSGAMPDPPRPRDDHAGGRRSRGG